MSNQSSLELEKLILIKKIDDLHLMVRTLTKENKKLHKRPILIIFDRESPNTELRIQGTRDNATELLKAGTKVKLGIEFEDGRKWRCETPMMVVETPDVIVETAEYHTHIEDGMVATKIIPKEYDNCYVCGGSVNTFDEFTVGRMCEHCRKDILR